ncbi:MAG: MSH system assembly platform protein MshJ [Idiomarinaceae bacterium HL-53]|nr:MAG: MSH system assembly platform protein MshJ [Idiomarinaceae bacterium HL-53]CUS47470.1 MSHA biogenesis protein MshJ [Idiomarinaceae bacterium HL-53]
MKVLMERFSAWFEAREIREQWLLSALMVAVLGWFLFIFLVEPSIKQRAEMRTELDAQAQRYATLQSQVNEIAEQVRVDPNEELEMRAEQLRRQEARLTQGLESRANFVQPQALLSWIQALLSESENLVLTHFDAKEAQPVFVTENTNARVLQHLIEVSLEGDFFGIHDYLQALTSLPIEFYWQALDYEVLQYPQARVTLELYTLSYGEIESETEGVQP